MQEYDRPSDPRLLPRKSREDLGRSARSSRPLEDHAALGPGERDPIAILEHQALSRVAGLVGLRYARMATSPFAFYRGAAAIMAGDLRELPDSGVQTQLCGDAHLSNVGFYASPERALVIDLNDFDETAPGPFEWDVKRMAASFEIAARARGFDDRDRSAIVERVGRAYAAAMDTAVRTPALELFTARLDIDTVMADIGSELPEKASERVEESVTKTYRRDSRQAADKLAVRDDDGVLRFKSDPPLLTPLRELAEREGMSFETALARLHDVLEQYRATLPPERRRLLERYRMVDAAMKVVGVGSVGTRAWVVLLQGDAKRDVLVLQAKEAQRSVIEPPDGSSAYAHQGQRVVRGQRIMQSLGDILLGWTTGEGFDGRMRDLYLRQFRDWKGSAEPERMEPATMRMYAQYCGIVLARAHARGGDPATISGYLGGGKTFAHALVGFAAAYADRTEADHAALLSAIASGRLEAATR
ncbi:DUF2252 domain-containing protein [Agromyces lapidis]|uniref:DUF2252 domain-containing protein n=1 Tax=Agromyces lapidis TaxID=279574 RepID=A0ABV5SKU2_9MICO|nr:DUF2252 domain-containing protein [Agromyces lapidis]